MIASVIQHFESYPEYKASGIEWLEEVPAHWEISRLRNTVTGCQNGVWGDEPDGSHDITCVRVADFDRLNFKVDLTDPTYRSIEIGVALARGLRSGDLLLEKSGGGENQPVGVVVLFDHAISAVCSNFVARVPVAKGFNPRYLALLHAALYAQGVNIRHIKQSTGIQNLDSSSYFNEAVALPPRREQDAIASFLDRKLMQIDALVEKKDRLIDLLLEHRAAVITQAVTQGLDPNVAMKDSGIEWLGMTPAHWSVERIKWASRMVTGHTPDKKVEAYWHGGDISWVSLADTGQLRRVDYIASTSVMTTSAGIANSSAHVLPAGTVVFSRDATIGLCAITRAGMAVSQHFIGWVCGERLMPEYLLFILRSMTWELERITAGATLSTIGVPEVKSLVTPIPPLTEQADIVRYVLERREELDSLIAKHHEAKDRLKEFRMALVSAAVTGRIDVREEVA